MKRYKEVARTYEIRLYAPGRQPYTTHYKCKTISELERFVAGYELTYTIDNWDIASVKYHYTND
jgi:hypothetical protein